MASSMADGGLESRSATLQYSKLPSPRHIRVMHLHPALDPGFELVFYFQEGTLDYLEDRYEAISYAWGAPVFSRQLRCDNGQYLEITENLDAALRRLRLPTATRALWTDAVCINQADSNDKSSQIPLMSDIYRRAAAVVVWLGQGDPTIERAIRSISNASRIPPSASRTSRTSRTDYEAALFSVLALPYFSRRWIIQEVVSNLEVTMFYGETKLSWLRLTQTLRYLKHDGLNMLPGPLRTVHTMSQLWSYHSQGSWALEAEDNGVDDFRMQLKNEATTSHSILFLLDRFANSHCSNPRDMIYAIAGLAYDVETIATGAKTRSQCKLIVRVDYKLDVESVYTQFARSAINRGYGLEVLYAAAERRHVRTTSTTSTKLPSWVPDLRISAKRFLWRSNHPYKKKRTFESSDMAPMDSRYCKIFFLAVVFGSLTMPGQENYVEDVHTFPVSCEGSNAATPNPVHFIHNFLKVATARCALYKDPVNFREDEDGELSKALIGISVLLGLHIPSDTISCRDFDHEIVREMLEARPFEDLSARARYALNELEITLQGCSFFNSNTGLLLGHARVAIQKGDRIVVPSTYGQVGLGSDYGLCKGVSPHHALLFRAAGNGRWRLIGEAGIVRYGCTGYCMEQQPSVGHNLEYALDCGVTTSTAWVHPHERIGLDLE